MKSEAGSSRDFLFNNLLLDIRLRSSIYFRPQFRAPWGISLTRQCAVFHIVTRGNCWIQVKGIVEPIRLAAGDFVVVTRGDEHVMRDVRDAPPKPPVNFFDLLKGLATNKNSQFIVGGDGAVTRLVCGGMIFEDATSNPLLAILPPLLHVKGTDKGATRWLRLTTNYVLSELDNGGAGAEEVITRLADILFIQAVRAYFVDNADTAKSGWLVAARDQQIGRALRLLHEHPQKPWTVASLAGQIATSRSALADRFTKLVGEPPLRYLTRLRINAAAARLRSTTDKLSAIAASAGYESVAAFVKSFRRLMGMPPGQYRKTHHSNRSK